MDDDRIRRVAPDDDRPEDIIDNGLRRLRRHDTVALSPSNAPALAGDLDEQGHIRRRIDRAVALANQIAAFVDALSFLQGAKIWHLSRNGDDEGFDLDDGVDWVAHARSDRAVMLVGKFSFLQEESKLRAVALVEFGTFAADERVLDHPASAKHLFRHMHAEDRLEVQERQ